MTDEHQPREPVQKPARTWDYSDHHLKAGGMQVAAVVIGFLVTLVLMGVIGLVWFYPS
jgi:hypothetical protein